MCGEIALSAAVDGPGAEAGTVEAAISGEELCRRYAEHVYRFAAMVSIDSHEADDLAQDALERALRALPSFDPARGPLEAWLWRIVVNAGRDAGRVARRRHLVEVALRLPPHPDPAPPDAPVRADDLDLLAAIRSLPPRPRALIALRYGADLDHAAIGRAVGMSPGAVRVGVHRALALLRRELSEDEE